VGRKSGEGSGLYFISQKLDGFWFKYCFCLLFLASFVSFMTF